MVDNGYLEALTMVRTMLSTMVGQTMVNHGLTNFQSWLTMVQPWLTWLTMLHLQQLELLSFILSMINHD